MLFTRLQFMKEKNMLYVCVQKKEEKKCDSNLRFIDNLWGEKIISALKSKLIIYGTCLNKKNTHAPLHKHMCILQKPYYGDQKISCM